MPLRTDLAIETRELAGSGKIDGVAEENFVMGGAKITRIEILNEKGAQTLGKSMGKYSTVEMKPFYRTAESDQKVEAVAEELKNMLPSEGAALVAGLGNTQITPDSLGPQVAFHILATRHLRGEVARQTGLEGMRPVAVLAPGVLGQTGMETGEIFRSMLEVVKPDFIIAIDAMASMRTSRLGCTVQMSDTGISPGSGVGNARPRLCVDTLGVPVISIGVPTVVDSSVVVYDAAMRAGMDRNDAERLCRGTEQAVIVTPREIDLLIERASRLLALAINCALHPQYSAQDFKMLLM